MRIWQLVKDKLTLGKGHDLAEISSDPITELDLSYWKTNDREWVSQRRAAWSDIEEMVLSVVEVKKYLPQIKAYYLRGEIPDWEKGQARYDPKPHLNLFLFLWLHPSWDETVLAELRESYINSPTVWHRDVKCGYDRFLSTQTIGTTLDYANVDGYESCPNLNGQGELLFRVMFVNPTIREITLQSSRTERPDGSDGKILSMPFIIPDPGFDAMVWMSQWLRLKKLVPVNEEFLYQYDDVLNYWYQNVKDKNYFDLKSNRRMKSSWYEIIYPFHHFDTASEGSTCRTRFVKNLRRILDEEQFFDEFNEMWSDIKNDKVKVNDAWDS
jgi:hypothetical protein